MREWGFTLYLYKRQGADAHPGCPDTCLSLETFAPTKDGSQKRVKNTEELAKMVDTTTP